MPEPVLKAHSFAVPAGSQEGVGVNVNLQAKAAGPGKASYPIANDPL